MLVILSRSHFWYLRCNSKVCKYRCTHCCLNTAKDVLDLVLSNVNDQSVDLTLIKFDHLTWSPHFKGILTWCYICALYIFIKEQKIDTDKKNCLADPTYMIRAIPSNASDNVYCTLLAQSAVHGAMAGYTGFTVGPVNGRNCYIPFHVSSCNSG